MTVHDHVSERRLREDIETNGEFGTIDADQGHGRTVLTGSEADRNAREYLVDRLEDAGCEVRVDAVGNIAGRWTPPSADPDAAPVAAGSHLDSVPEGGIFDGPLGVYSALEAVRAMQDAGFEPDRPVEVVSFTEEEGQRFSIGLLGSYVATGRYSVDEALAFEDDDGVSLETHLENIGFQGEGLLDLSSWAGWYEIHVEQGTRLEEADVPVGVVTAITGITNCRVEIEGEANHAGSTPMPDRTDAVCAASEFVLDVERAAREIVATDSETAVGTIGILDVEPNARNVVPGRASMSMDIRDVEQSSIDEVVDRARKSLARLETDRGVSTDLDRYRDQEPTPMSDRCRRIAHEAGIGADIETMDMHSAAGHDTMNVARETEAALLFAPSKDGISHNPLEWTDWEDCATATRVLAGAMADLAAD